MYSQHLLSFQSKMARGKEFSTETRARIQALSNEGLSQRQIATWLKISKAVVHYTMKRIAMIGGHQSKTRCSRPRITNKRTDKLIKRMVVASPGISSKEIRRNLNGLPQKLSERTIRHRLNTTLGLKAYRPAKKPLLSRKNVADRLRFARQHLNWTAEAWANVMFSDETIVAQFRVGHTTIRRPAKQRYNKRYTEATVKHPTTVMIWWYIASSGRGGLFFLPPKTTKAKITGTLICWWISSRHGWH